MLTPEELERYDRQIPVIGLENQVKLKNTRVLVAGLGGLGSAVSLYLAAAGIGSLVLVDDGFVELSNLQRQVLYSTEDVGKPKALVAAEKLKKLNPHITVKPVVAKLTYELGEELIREVDVLVDALDNWETRVVLDKLAFKYGKPLVHAGVEGFYGQLTTIIPGKTPCLRCIFQVQFPKKAERRVNVVATTPGILGVLEANEVIKLVTGLGEVYANKLLVYDGLRGEIVVLNINVDLSKCSICYEY